MSRRRKRYDRLKKTVLKRGLAIRDSLVPEGAFERTANPLVRCAECDSLIPFDVITLGHIQPRSEGGHDHPTNLRLECTLCNQSDNHERHVIHSFLRKPNDKVTPDERRRLIDTEKRARQQRKGHLYDSIRVQDVRGLTIAFTSIDRVCHLVEVGRVRLVEQDGDGRPKAIQLVEDRPIRNPYQTPHENICVICDARRHLRAVPLWPLWHPECYGAKKSHRTVPLCFHCSLTYQKRTVALLRENEIPFPPERSAARTAAHAARTALSLFRDGIAFPTPLLEKAKRYGEVDLLAYLSPTDPKETEKSLRGVYLEHQEILRTRMGVWKWGVRRWAIEQKIDYEAVFWKFAESRRALFAPYLRTDGRFMRELREYLHRVRTDRRSDPSRVGLEKARFPLLPYALKERK